MIIPSIHGHADYFYQGYILLGITLFLITFVLYLIFKEWREDWGRER